MTAGRACANVASLLPAYAAGALSPAETRVVTDHLGLCPACLEQLHEWRLIVAAANVAASGPPPSPEVLNRVRASIELHHASRRHSPHHLWSRLTGGHRRRLLLPSSRAGADPDAGWDAGYPRTSVRSAISEIAVIAVVILVVGGGLVGRAWWGRDAGQESPAAQVQPGEQPPSPSPAPGGLSFASTLSNEVSHPGANLRLGRLTMESGSSTELAPEDGSVLLMVEAGAIDALVDGPATLTQDGQTRELATGERFELRPGDHLRIPAGTSSELGNDGQDPALALDLRIQAPGAPPRFTNGAQYRQLVRVPAKDLPSGQLDFSLAGASLSPGAVHEIDGPGLLYVEAGTLAITETNADLDFEGSDDLDDDDSSDSHDSGPDERIAAGGWFFLDEGDHASLTVPDGPAAYLLELLFE